jgi:hypothetical protein
LRSASEIRLDDITKGSTRPHVKERSSSPSNVPSISGKFDPKY